MSLKTKLQKMRVNTGMTQQELAVKANMNIVTLQKLETGVNKINGARANLLTKLKPLLTKFSKKQVKPKQKNKSN